MIARPPPTLLLPLLSTMFSINRVWLRVAMCCYTLRHVSCHDCQDVKCHSSGEHQGTSVLHGLERYLLPSRHVGARDSHVSSEMSDSDYRFLIAVIVSGIVGVGLFLGILFYCLGRQFGGTGSSQPGQTVAETASTTDGTTPFLSGKSEIV